MTTLFILSILAFAYWNADKDSRWWITYAGIIVILTKAGVRINILELGLSIIFWRVIKDIFQR